MNQQKRCNVWIWEERRLREGWCSIQLKMSAVTDNHGIFCSIHQFACLLPSHEPMWLWMKRFILADLECLMFSSDLQGLVHHHQNFLTLEMMIQLTYLLLKGKCSLLQLSFVCEILLSFLIALLVWTYLLSCSKFDILTGKSVFTHLVWTNVTSIGTTYNPTMGDDIKYRENYSCLGWHHVGWSYPREQ